MTSVFTARPRSEWVASNDLAFAICDGFPVSEGHTLVIPKREVATWFDATPEEQLAIVRLIDEVKKILDDRLRPDGYNVGFNAGEAAGQTVMHLHLHVIPRKWGDMDDPRGGVRHVIPWKGNYRAAPPSHLSRGGQLDPFVDHVRPLIRTSTDIAIVAAFVQDSGLELLAPDVFEAMDRGCRFRLVTGDYLNITQVDALERLLGWMARFPDVADVADVVEAGEAGEAEEAVTASGTLDVRVVTKESFPGRLESFHPKSWKFEGPAFGTAFVGSSNISRTALWGGVEWNLRVQRTANADAYLAVSNAFEELWSGGLRLTAEWVRAYAARVRESPLQPPPGETEEEALPPPPFPHDLQEEALAELSAARAAGRRRALVVMATGLGKTWLAAFDILAWKREKGRWPRILVVAHRAELLDQAAGTLRSLFHAEGRNASIGWCAGAQEDLGADAVMASVQKLSRTGSLKRLERHSFDYVVIDEVHHAWAPSYRRLLSTLEPDFLLGLTATPDRMDEGDILGLFDDFLAYRADLGKGISAQRLVPFHYHGLKDDVDYANIPWRNTRFDPGALAEAVQTKARMEKVWEAWEAHPASRTVVFCCSLAHMEFVRAWLADRGVRVKALSAETPLTERASALERLRSGDLEALCAVDLLNEGVDVPRLDRVVLLRPTESPVVFLQQLGRGLRVAEGKEALTAIDFVGNHRVFLDRVRTLLSFGGGQTPIRDFLEKGTADLPEGCSVEIELEAVDLLSRLVPKGTTEVERAYRELREAKGRRPRAGELYRLDYLVSRLQGWFAFVGSEKDLSNAEARAWKAAQAWFRDLEATTLEKSFKMVTLEVLVEADALWTGLPVEVLARRAHALLCRSPELFHDIENVSRFPDPRNPEPKAWKGYWTENPVHFWTKGAHSVWFEVRDGLFVGRFPDFALDVEARDAFTEMTAELVDYRLAQYRSRLRRSSAGPSFDARVTWNQRDPILKLPSQKERPDLARGEWDVRLPDGSAWRFRFMKEFCNVAHSVGSASNGLPDLLRNWFGPSAGRPGTNHHVRFEASPDGWWVLPRDTNVVRFPTRMVRAFPTLRAAAGMLALGEAGEYEAERIPLGVGETATDLFAVRAAGDSMDGGREPIRDGDWVLLRPNRGSALKNIAGKVALVQTDEGEGDLGFRLKEVVRRGHAWLLHSFNPSFEDVEASESTIPIAVKAGLIRPEEGAPEVGARFAEADLAKAFGLPGTPRHGRVHGLLFLFLQTRGDLEMPDRVALPWPDRRPGETAYVLSLEEEARVWRYCGVGRWLESEARWAIPDVDFRTWRALGGGRSASRRVSAEAIDQAREMVERFLGRFPAGSAVDLGGRPVRMVGLALDGGLRIDGGEGGFKVRTVSLLDIAWVIVAGLDVKRNGGRLDEARVNRFRYLEGTPKGSTRWVDTGWAVRVVKALGEPALPSRG